MIPMMIDARDNPLANKFLDTFRNKVTQSNNYWYLAKFFRYIFDKEGLLPAEVDFNKFTSVRIGNDVSFKVPISQAYIMQYISDTYKTATAIYSPLGSLKCFFRYCYERNMILSNPAEGIAYPKRIKRLDQPRLLSEKECMWMLVAAAKMGINRFTLIYALVAIGGRTREILGLRRSNIDPYLEQIYLDGKTNLRRRPLVPGLKETLFNQYFKSDFYLKMAAMAEQDYVFFSESKADGSPLGRFELNRIINEIAKQAGIEKRITVYWFRITLINILDDHGVNLSTNQQIIDHDDIISTQNYLRFKKKKSVADMIEKSTLSKITLDVQNRVIKQLTEKLNR